MTLRDEHNLSRMSLSHQKGKAQPPSVHGTHFKAQKGNRRAGGSGTSYRVDEARVYELQLELEVLALRQRLQSKVDQLQSKTIDLAAAEDYIEALEQENEKLQRKLTRKTEQVKALRQESRAIFDQPKASGEASANAHKEQNPSKVIEKFRQAKADFSWIILRNLVDKAQAQLAVTAGIVGADSNVSRRSLAWREALNGKNGYNTDKRRMQTAKSLLSASKDEPGIPAAAFSLLNSAAGHLVTDNSTELRQRGDQVAHSRLYMDDIMQAISSIEITPQLEEGIKMLADFLGLAIKPQT